MYVTQKITIIEKNPQKSGIKLIAEMANVSIGTVDRVLHDRPGVSKKTKEVILRVIKELEYEPNILARRLVSKKKYNFFVLIPKSTTENPYWSSHIIGINKAVEEIKQYGVLVKIYTFDQNSNTSFSKELAKIKKEEVDGVLMVPFFHDESVDFVSYFASKQIPVVFFDTNLADIEVLSYVGQDAFKSGLLAGKLISYLLTPNETVFVISINAFKKSNNHINFLKREEGFRKFIAMHNSFQLKVLNYNSEKSESTLEEEVLNFLKVDLSIKVIFVTNSRAYKVTEILRKHNITNLKVVGYDLIEQNLENLKNNGIDFLISQNPIKQGYSGVMTLFRSLLLKQPVDRDTLMPIEIVMKDNLEFVPMN